MAMMMDLYQYRDYFFTLYLSFSRLSQSAATQLTGQLRNLPRFRYLNFQGCRFQGNGLK